MGKQIAAIIVALLILGVALACTWGQINTVYLVVPAVIIVLAIGLFSVHRTLDKLAEVVFGQQQERYEELWQAVAAGHEAHARHESDVQSLRKGTRERMDWFSGRIEELSGQLRQQCGQLSGVQAKVDSLEHLYATVAGLSSQVDVWCEQLDKQGEVLRSLCEAQNQRAAVMGQFLDVLNRLRAATVVSECCVAESAAHGGIQHGSLAPMTDLQRSHAELQVAFG